MSTNATSKNGHPSAPSPRRRQSAPGTGERGRQPTVSHPKPTTPVPIARPVSRSAYIVVVQAAEGYPSERGTDDTPLELARLALTDVEGE